MARSNNKKYEGFKSYFNLWSKFICCGLAIGDSFLFPFLFSVVCLLLLTQYSFYIGLFFIGLILIMCISLIYNTNKKWKRYFEESLNTILKKFSELTSTQQSDFLNELSRFIEISKRDVLEAWISFGLVSVLLITLCFDVITSGTVDVLSVLLLMLVVSAEVIIWLVLDAMTIRKNLFEEVRMILKYKVR